MAEDSIERDGLVTAAQVVHHRNGDGATYLLQARCARCVAGVLVDVVEPCCICGEQSLDYSIFCARHEPPF